MSSRKEDERNERTIRNLLKLPDNRRCINCNSLGPQYVCTNFWTFVCTNCSGIHREFTHRVKSISMAKFTSQEVSALQGGGNASAKEIYLKEWDPQRQSLPDGSNVERLRDFIKHVYVERRYSGERGSEKPPRGKLGGTEDSYEHRRNDSFQSASRSPTHDDANERRLSDRLSSGGRSPAYEQDNRQYDKRSPARTEVVNDWRREDRFGNARRLEDRVSDGGYKFDSRSPDRQRDAEVSSPVVRPVREILGDNVSPLRVLEPPKGDVPRTQRTASSSSLASSNGNPSETKFETSLIDFDAAPEPPAPPAPPVEQSPQAATSVPVAQAATPSNDNWANFDSVAEVKASQPPANTNPLESMLSELSVPSSAPGNLSGTPGSGTVLPPTTAATIAAFPGTQQVASFGLPYGNVVPPTTVANSSAAFLSGPPPTAPGPVGLPQSGGNALGNAVPGGHWSQPQPQSLFPTVSGLPLLQPSMSPAIRPASNEPWNPLSASNPQGFPSVPTAVKPTLETSTGLATQKSLDVKSSGRSELPEDLFSMSYSQIPARAPGWNMGPSFGMGFNMQHNMQMPVAAFPQATNSTNPFDVNNDPPLAQPFPSMASLQGVLPNMPAQTNLLQISSLGVPAAHPSAMLPNSASYAYVMPSNTNMMPQWPSNIPARPLGPMNFGMDAGAFGHLSSNQPMGGLQSLPAAPNNFSSVGGNPFG